MKHAAIDIRIGRLVVDASRHSEAAGLADAIGQALQQRLTGSEASAVHAEAPRAVADRIAARLTTTSGAGAPRGKL
ncbi:hypothetical protein CT676_31535 [Bradyrhizobium sp. MOS001]|uniref:hypothetical protein n=1 Tax=Bradyrhizobium sp. MOS001 TaxID=2133948 RepID=UPI0010755BD6|nr:hypothetical protein [Bradyrhizobium sp. MOS001]TFW57152.1 hypothetical protein CT676_31535 [Bradyrhizobium sp. MOS001]